MISLGIDIGGTGCKCVAFRDTGEQIAMSYREYPTKPGEVNLNALALRESVFFVISDCVKKLDDAKQVAAITVSSFGESFVPVDRSGQPLSDIILYFANTESGEFSRLIESVGVEKFMRITCVLPDASYSLAKMLYTLRTAPRPVWKFLFIASYICFCLSGETVADYSLACRSILFDVRRLCWSDELTSACGIDPATLQEGKTEVLEMLLEDTIRHLRYRFLGRETKKIRSMGTFRTLKFACQIGTSEGYSFTDGTEFTVWISDDKNLIPLYIESPVRIGSVQAYISGYHGLKYPLSSKIK